VRYLIILLIFSNDLFAQVVQNVELEVVGRPSWQNIIPVGKSGLFLFTKTDQAKAKAIMFDSNLQKQWETELFLDVERAPTAYTYDDTGFTFLFRETSGMYYQVLIFDLKSGKYQSKGFELREFFDDQDYVFLGQNVLLVGANKSGAAFYNFNFKSDSGKMIETPIKGKVQIQELRFDDTEGKINTIWSVKEIAYSNAKRKKGEFIKDAFLNIATFDTTGVLIENSRISQKNGNFPMTAQSVKLNKELSMLIGVYQAKSGDKGLFWTSDFRRDGAPMRFKSFSEFVNGQPELSSQDMQKLLKEFNFLMHPAIFSQNSMMMGGVFYKAEYKSVTQQVYNPYDNFSPNRNWGFARSGSRSHTIFSGFNYPFGFVANLSLNNQTMQTHRIDIRQMNPQIRQPLSFNTAGSVAYCVKGNLATKNFNIGTKPILYKLSDEEQTASNQAFLPSFQEVKFWYDNYFIAVGSKTKIEVLKLDNSEMKPSLKRKRNQNATFTQARKTIYLTKIASGSMGEG
jgi:hypothetical protein